MSLDLYISNDNVLTLVGLQNSVDSSWINSATVTVTLVDSAGTELTGVSWPLSLSYVSASNGNYRVTLPDTITGLSNLDDVVAQLTADGGAGLRGYWELPIVAKTRTS